MIPKRLLVAIAATSLFTSFASLAQTNTPPLREWEILLKQSHELQQEGSDELATKKAQKASVLFDKASNLSELDLLPLFNSSFKIETSL